jgi:copper resistance protein D
MTFALILVRWLHLSATILLGGLFVFEQAILIPVARVPSEITASLLDTIHLLTCRTALWTLLVALISWFGWSWLVASTMSGDGLVECFQNGEWLSVLSGTQFGYIWLFRAILGLVFGMFLWMAAQASLRQSFLRTAFAGLSIIELFSLAWAGHARASPGPLALIHLLGDGFHLLALAFWPGALAPLAVFLLSLLKSRQAAAIALASPVVRRFSVSSLTAVALLALTGLLNSIFMVGSFTALLTSAYGQILISKLILFLAMIGFGAWNLLFLKSRIGLDLSTVRLEKKSALVLLLRNVLCEIGLGILVVLIVGLLGITPPPRPVTGGMTRSISQGKPWAE